MADGIVTADFLFSLEKRMRVLNEYNYSNMLASENIWWNELARKRDFTGKSERVEWMLQTASIEQVTPNDGGEEAGNIAFEEVLTLTTEYFPAAHRKGFKIGKLKMLNMMGGGLDPAGSWAGAIGTYGAYYPQRLLAQILLAGDQTGNNSYDAVSFFNSAHPTNPLIPALGTYANLFTGSSSGTYPGALPIDDSQTDAVALQNLAIGLSYIVGKVSQPNGNGDPRLLEPRYLLHPPRMEAQVNKLLDADFIASAVGSAGGTSDIRGYLKKYRLAEPVMAKELDASRSYTFPGPGGADITVTGDDKAWYVVCDEADEGELGAFFYGVRQPFTLHTYTGEGSADGVDAVLGRSQELEWHYDGYMSMNYGHPFTIFKFKAT